MTDHPDRGSKGRLYVVSGPSGAGKGTLIREVLKHRPDIVLSVSATTRPARSRERHGKHYLFISEAEFLAKRDRGEFLESAQVYGHFYGTPRDQVERALQRGRDVIVEVDIQGAVSVKRAKPDAVLIFIEPPSLDDLPGRLRGRGTEDPEDFGRRIRAAYDEIKVRGTYDHIIINDKLDRAVEDFLRILEANP